jgi:hypothetical protein
LPFAWPFDPVASLRLGLERRLERLAFLRVIEVAYSVDVGVRVCVEVGWYQVKEGMGVPKMPELD